MRSGRIHWATIAFLSGFAVLLILLLSWYFVPSLLILRDPQTSDVQKRHVAAYSTLLVAVIGVMLFIGLLITFRVRRYFFPEDSQRSRTNYSDAWAESARRLQPRQDEDDAR